MYVGLFIILSVYRWSVSRLSIIGKVVQYLFLAVLLMSRVCRCIGIGLDILDNVISVSMMMH